MMSRGAIRNALHQLPASTEPWDAASNWDVKLLKSFCPDTSFLHALEKSMASAQAQGEDSNYAHPHWVDFVLTSANTWKQPIEDFTLIVERGASYAVEEKTLVSFCSPQHAEVKKLNESQFQMHVTRLIPTSELRIGFFDLPLTASGRGSVK
jgi:hypothetical protein